MLTLRSFMFSSSRSLIFAAWVWNGILGEPGESSSSLSVSDGCNKPPAEPNSSILVRAIKLLSSCLPGVAVMWMLAGVLQTGVQGTVALDVLQGALPGGLRPATVRQLYSVPGQAVSAAVARQRTNKHAKAQGRSVRLSTLRSCNKLDKASTGKQQADFAHSTGCVPLRGFCLSLCGLALRGARGGFGLRNGGAAAGN